MEQRGPRCRRIVRLLIHAIRLPGFLFYKKGLYGQIGYQQQLSGAPRLWDGPCSLPLRAEFPLLCGLTICPLICLPLLSSPLIPPLLHPLCVLCGIKVQIRQMDTALDQSQGSILPDRLRPSDIWQLRSILGEGLWIVLSLEFGLKSCLVLIGFDMLRFHIGVDIQYVNNQFLILIYF